MVRAGLEDNEQGCGVQDGWIPEIVRLIGRTVQQGRVAATGLEEQTSRVGRDKMRRRIHVPWDGWQVSLKQKDE